MVTLRLQLDLALAVDTINLVGAALHDLARRSLLPVAMPLLCDADDSWLDGELFNKAITQVETRHDHNDWTLF